MDTQSTRSARTGATAPYLAQLFERRRPELTRLCRHWSGGNRADADDLFGDACLRAVQAAARVDAPPDNPFAWLTKIVRNLAVDRLRATESCEPSDRAATWQSPDPDALTCFATRELLHRTASELLRLPPSQRRSLLARALGDDYPAIASRIGTTPQGVRKLVQTARCRLRARLGLALPPRLQAT